MNHTMVVHFQYKLETACTALNTICSFLWIDEMEYFFHYFPVVAKPRNFVLASQLSLAF